MALPAGYGYSNMDPVVRRHETTPSPRLTQPCASALPGWLGTADPIPLPGVLARGDPVNPVRCGVLCERFGFGTETVVCLRRLSVLRTCMSVLVRKGPTLERRMFVRRSRMNGDPDRRRDRSLSVAEMSTNAETHRRLRCAVCEDPPEVCCPELVTSRSNEV